MRGDAWLCVDSSGGGGHCDTPQAATNACSCVSVTTVDSNPTNASTALSPNLFRANLVISFSSSAFVII